MKSLFILMLLPSLFFGLNIQQKSLFTLHPKETWLSNQSFLTVRKSGVFPTVLSVRSTKIYITTKSKQYGSFDEILASSRNSRSWGFSLRKGNRMYLVSSFFGKSKNLPIGTVEWSFNHQKFLILYRTNKQEYVQVGEQTFGPFEYISEQGFLPQSLHWKMKAKTENQSFLYYDGNILSVKSNSVLLEDADKITVFHSPNWENQAFVLTKGEEKFVVYKNRREGPYQDILNITLSDSDSRFAYFYKKGWSHSLGLATDSQTTGFYWNAQAAWIRFAPHKGLAWAIKKGKKKPTFVLFVNGKKIGEFKNLRDFEWGSSTNYKASFDHNSQPTLLLNGKSSESYFHLKWYGFAKDGKNHTYLGEKKNGLYLIDTTQEIGPFKQVSDFAYTSTNGEWVATAQHFNTLWYIHTSKNEIFGPYNKIESLKASHLTWWARIIRDKKVKTLIDGIELENQGLNAVCQVKDWFWFEEKDGKVWLSRTGKF